MGIKKVLKFATIAVAALGIAATSTLTMFATLGNENKLNLFSDETRTYSCEYYVDDVLVHSEIKKRGEPINYNEIPTKHSDVDGTFYVFTGWDYNNDGITDIPQVKAYMNFKAHALFTRFNIPNIDYAKLLQILQDLNIDLESFLNYLGLDWEDIAELLKDPVIKFTTDQEGLVYFRTESFGDYDSKMARWNDADYYPLENISDGSVNPLVYAGTKVQLQNYYPVANFELEYVKGGGKYPVPSVEVKNDQRLPSDSYSLVNPPNGKYKTQGLGFLPATKFIIDMAGLIPFPEAVKKDELNYRIYAQNHYLNIDDRYKNYFLELTQAADIDTSSVGSAVDGINKFYASQGYKFNLLMKNYPRNEDNILYFMSTAKEGTGRQFASATTMWLRALGYPARYTQGYTTYAKATGEEEIVNAIQAHAWCEVYVNNLGWMSIDGALAGELDAIKDTPFNPFFDEDDDVDLDQYNHERQLIRIEKNDMTKTHYIVGQTISEDDVFVNAYYSDGYEDVVKPTYFVAPDMTTWGYKDVLCVYVEHSVTKTCKYTIFVEPAKVESMSPTLLRTGKIYTDEPDLTPFDFEFVGAYTDGIDRIISSENVVVTSITPAQNIEGLHRISFSFTENYPDGDSRTVDCSYDFETYKRPAPVSIIPEFEKDEYWQYEEYETLEFTVYFDDGSEKYVTSDDPGLTIDELPLMDVPGQHAVNYTYTCDGGQISYEHDFHVTEIYLVSIEAEMDPTIFRIDYDDANIDMPYRTSIIAHYNNGNEREIDPLDSSVTFSTVDMSYAHEEDVEITYTETLYSGEPITCIVDVHISVVKVSLQSIELASEPRRTYYTYETVDLTGTLFLLNFDYDVSSFEEFGSDRFSMEPVDTSTSGIKTVTVSYTYGDVTKSCSFDIEVIGLESIEIEWEESGIKDTYYKHHIDGYFIFGTAYFSDGSTSYIDQSDPNMGVTESQDETSLTIHVDYTLFGVTRSDEKTIGLVDLEIVEMSLILNDVQTEFMQGDIFNAYGIEAYILYNDGVEEYAGLSQLNIEHIDEELTISGDIVINVTYTPYEDVSASAQYTIHVFKINGLTLDTSGVRTLYQEPTIYHCFNVEYPNGYNPNIPAKLEFEDGTIRDVTGGVYFELNPISEGIPGETNSVYEITGHYTYKERDHSSSFEVEAITYKLDVSYSNKGEVVYWNDQFIPNDLTSYLCGSDGSTQEVSVSYDPNVDVGYNDVTFSTIYEFDAYGSIVDVGYNVTNSVLVKKLESLSVYYENKDEVEFLRGDEFAYDFVTYIAYFTDGTYEEIPADLIDKPEVILNHNGDFHYQPSLTLGTVTVVGDLPYRVIEPIATEITPNTDDVQTVFSRYETFNSTGLSLTVTYENGFSEVIYSSFDVDSSMYDSSNLGTYPIYITYTHLSHSGTDEVNSQYDVTVIERELIRIEIQLNKNEFFEGETITSDDYKVIGYYKTGPSVEQEVEEYSIDIPEFNEFGTYTITATSFVNPSLSATADVTYSKIVPIKLELNTGLVQTKFLINSTFNYDGLTAYGRYNNGDTEYVPQEELIISEFPDLSTSGNKTVTVKAFIGGSLLEATYTITVIERDPTITLLGYTGRTQINCGQINYRPTDGQLEFLYDYGGIEQEHIFVDSSEYTYEVISGEIDTSTVGNTWTIRYSARGKYIDVIFTVVEPAEKLIDYIDSGTIRTSFSVGEDIDSRLDLGYIVVYYTNGTTKDTYNYKCNGLDTSTATEPGKQRVMRITYYEARPDGSIEEVWTDVYYTVG